MPHYKGYIPLKHKTPPPPPPSSSNSQENKKEPSLLSAMANGMAFGTGSSIAHKTIGVISDYPSTNKNQCIDLLKLYEECMKSQTNCELHTKKLKEFNC